VLLALYVLCISAREHVSDEVLNLYISHCWRSVLHLPAMMTI